MPAASIPVWVPAVLLALVALGYRQSRTRTVRPATLVGVAAGMFAFSLYGVAAAFDLETLSLLVWFSAYAAAVLGGTKVVSPSGMAIVDRRVSIPGSWVPMGLLLGIFAAKFVLGFAAAMHSPVLHDTAFVIAMSAVLGLLSGGFGARAVAVHRFASGAKPA